MKQRNSSDYQVYPTDGDDCDQCVGILEELENIDDDCDRHGITFVKTQVSLFSISSVHFYLLPHP